MDTLRFFNPYEDIRCIENLLPHWQQEDATYFITFRLADSIPAHLRRSGTGDLAAASFRTME
jgi:hypothetical protein